jgi:2,4-dienoyl-CoA reductase-like NADH-dependent reductase (Old Yellow Enzyme family)
VHRHGTVLFGQLFHPGREIAEADGGLLAVAYAPSCVPNERFHVMPRPLKQAMIARSSRLRRRGAAHAGAGLDGVEIVASHGYLPSQFLNPRVNLRDDAYGGGFDRRLRFLREVIADIRAKVDEHFVVGLRISGAKSTSRACPRTNA